MNAGEPLVAVQEQPGEALTENDPAPPPAVKLRDPGLTDAGHPVMIEKLTLEISKKILPTASTFILAEALVTNGKETECEPSFGVLAARTVGNVIPPLVEREILTAAQLTGTPLVPATSQITVCEVPAIQLSGRFGWETWNGPLNAETVT
jgi:hypothetical protein